jgi:hypothetical protein
MTELGTRAFFALASAKLKKKRESAKKKKHKKKAKAPSAKEKKRKFALFLVFAEHRTGSPVPGPNVTSWGGGARICPVLPVYSACPVQPVLFSLSCSACPVQPVLFCLSYSACPVLPVMFLPVLS